MNKENFWEAIGVDRKTLNEKIKLIELLKGMPDTKEELVDMLINSDLTDRELIITMAPIGYNSPPKGLGPDSKSLARVLMARTALDYKSDSFKYLLHSARSRKEIAEFGLLFGVIDKMLDSTSPGTEGEENRNIVTSILSLTSLMAKVLGYDQDVQAYQKMLELRESVSIN